MSHQHWRYGCYVFVALGGCLGLQKTLGVLEKKLCQRGYQFGQGLLGVQTLRFKASVSERAPNPWVSWS